MVEQTGSADRLWIEQYARFTGIEWCCRRIWGERGTERAPYLFIIVIWGTINVIPRLIAPHQYGTLLFSSDPAAVFVLVAVLGVVALLRRIRHRYQTVITKVPDSVSVPEQNHSPFHRLLRIVGIDTPLGQKPTFAQIVPDRITATVLVLGWGFYTVWFVTTPAPLSPLVEIYDPVIARAKVFVLIPLVYYVVAAETIATYLGVLLFFPSIITLGNRIEFTDPAGYGGLRPVGVFIRDMTGVYLVLLSVYIVFETLALGTSPTDPFSLGVVTAGTLLGAILFITPVYLLHRHMAHHKERKVDELAREVKATGPPDDTKIFPETTPRETADYREYTHAYIQLQTVRDMRELPISVGIVFEMFSVLVLPYVVSLTSDTIAGLLP